ncbi:MAG: DNA replication/repair protein RecF [bacterium]
MSPCRIRHISLYNFRSYTNANIALDGKPVVVTGPNGSGKTNLLEAVSILSAGRGMRHAKLIDLQNQQATDGWAVTIKMDQPHSSDLVKIGTGTAGLASHDKRRTRIDDQTARGPSAMLEYLRVLWLTPAQDRLFMEGANERRRFLDRMVLAHEPGHAEATATYETAMRQRNRLLEQWPNIDASLATILERQMAQAGIAIAAARRMMASRLAFAVDLLPSSSFPVADIALEGSIEHALAEQPASNVEDDFAMSLARSRALEAKAGRCLSGPHRSDLLVSHRAKNQAARLCSTGEQKALLIGLVLANAKAIQARAPDAPPLILLLDEIAAHLDNDRRADLFNILYDLNYQCFMTGTDRELFSTWQERAQYLTVAAGSEIMND